MTLLSTIAATPACGAPRKSSRHVWQYTTRAEGSQEIESAAEDALLIVFGRTPGRVCSFIHLRRFTLDILLGGNCSLEVPTLDRVRSEK